MSELDSLDHVAIPVADVASAVEWYTKTFRCEVKYRDETWALLAFANTRVALVVPEQHPAHLRFVSPDAERSRRAEDAPGRDAFVLCQRPGGEFQVEILAER